MDPRDVDLSAVGYVEEEWFASGTASDFTGVGDLDPDGFWGLRTKGSAPYATRLVVRRPADPADGNGVVALEWLNVSALELSPDWSYLSDAITDEGVTWIGVSAQALGITGGQSLIETGSADQDSANQGIRGTNPERYGRLDHPGDAFAYDIYSQVAAALRSPRGAAVLGGVPLERILAIGESQSAGWLTSYIDGFQPTTDLFDGFFVHSRGSGSAGLDVAGPFYMSDVATRFRTDLDMPIMVIEAETDVGSRGRYALARQPDTEHLRVWEMAGTAHSDTYMVGSFDLGCGLINSGPQHWIAKAAFAGLLGWVETGEPPASAPRLETDGPTSFRRDEHGNTLGGVRTPAVDVPVSQLRGRRHRVRRPSARCSGRRLRSTPGPCGTCTRAAPSTSSASRPRSTKRSGRGSSARATATLIWPRHPRSRSPADWSPPWRPSRARIGADPDPRPPS